MFGGFPRGASLYVSKFREVSCDGFSEEGDVKIASLGDVTFHFIEFFIDAIGELGPIGVETAFPSGGVPAEEPALVGVWTETIAALPF